MIDLVLINSRVLHKRVIGEAMGQVDIRAEAICKMGMSTEKRIKRSKVEEDIQLKKKKGPASPFPIRDIYMDNAEHWCVLDGKKQR